MKHLNATPQSRFLAYFIDYAIVGAIADMILGFIVYPVLKFNPDLLEEKTNIFMDNLSQGVMDYELVNQILTLCFIIIGVTIAVMVPIVIIYFCIIPLFWEKQTVGRLAAGLKVVSLKDEGKVGFGWLILREVFGGYILTNLLGSSLMIPLCYTIYASITKGRSLSDMLGKTRLVNIRSFVAAENMYDFYEQENNGSSSDYVDAKFKEVQQDKKEEYNSDDDYMVI